MQITPAESSVVQATLTRDHAAAVDALRGYALSDLAVLRELVADARGVCATGVDLETDRADVSAAEVKQVLALAGSARAGEWAAQLAPRSEPWRAGVCHVLAQVLVAVEAAAVQAARRATN